MATLLSIDALLIIKITFDDILGFIIAI